MQMAEALLGIVIEKLGSIIQDELATFWGVEQQTQGLYSNLTAIRAVLKDAERKQITSHAVKDWLQKLTDAAYVLEDILDDCSIHSKTVQSHAQKYSFLARFHPKDTPFRPIGKRMKEITQRFHDLDEERRTFQLRGGVMENQPQEYDEDWRKTISAISEPVIYGRGQDREKIVEFLLGHASNIEDLSIFPIVGMGGLGKTTLARQVFNDDRVSKHFDLTIWICVSTEFSIERILQSIIQCSTVQNPNLSDLEAMRKKVQEVLQSKRYLLVLDDVWNEDQYKWKKLKGVLQCARGTKGSTVLVTTRLGKVASIMETQPAHRLVELSEEDSWSLFKHHAFGPNAEEREELVAIGKDIVRKCVGSPLAIKTLGTLLHDESQVEQWQNVKGSEIWDIKEESSITNEENPIMRALKLSYLNLELSLRRCFTFCAIFPKDSEIVKEELIHLWMANGFIKSKGSLEVEDVGQKVWEKLYHRSFFQEAKKNVIGIITSFKMHDLFHDLAQAITVEECKVSEDTEMTDLSRRVHHLHLLKFNGPANMPALKKVESLRTLLGSRSLPSNGSLRALQSCASQSSTMMNLAQLRYLNLCWSYATSLPNSMCGLQKLQILKLQDLEYLHCLPKDLTQLQDLRHLVIEGCYSIAEMPPNIGKLSQLRTLSSFVVGSKPGYGLAELNDLKLGGKLHIRGLENVPNELDAQQANLISKKDLNRLYLSWGESTNSEGSNVNAERVPEALEPPSTLKSFGMRRYQGTQLPSWMRNPLVLKDLVEVILFGCKNKEFPPLGKLPHLKRLYIEEMNDVKHIDGESYEGADEKAFPSLEKLTVRELPKLERVLRDEGIDILPRLRELIIDAVPNLKLPRLPSVEHLEARKIKEGASFMEVVVGNSPCLKTLKIDTFEKLKVLPDQLSSLGALQELHITNCKELESLSEDVLQGLTSLRSLNILCCSKLKSLSEGVGHLACLERRELVDVPNNMNQLTALREVRIINSPLPEGLQHIPSLQTLVIHHCTSLPGWLGDMTSLRQLGIYFCPELRSLPSNIQRLTNLRELSIKYCPELEKRCKKETGEDWQYIAHIPQLLLGIPFARAEFETEKETFHGKILLTLKKLQIRSAKKFATRFAKNALPHIINLGDKFDNMFDDR